MFGVDVNEWKDSPIMGRGKYRTTGLFGIGPKSKRNARMKKFKLAGGKSTTTTMCLLGRYSLTLGVRTLRKFAKD